MGAMPAKAKIVANLHAALLGRVYTQRFGPQFADADASIVEMYNAIKDRSVIGTNGSAVAWIRGAGFQIKISPLEKRLQQRAKRSNR